jgi:transposase InsO family protein
MTPAALIPATNAAAILRSSSSHHASFPRSFFGRFNRPMMLVSLWRLDYNHRRPHSSLGYVPSAAFAAKEVELVILS